LNPKPKVACQWDNGVCSQCGLPLAQNWRRGCVEGRAEFVTAPNVAVDINTEPCRFLGEPTGQMLKQSCKSKPEIEEHVCLCPARQFTGRDGKTHNKKCTFDQPCQDSNIIQFCGRCALWEAASPAQPLQSSRS